MGKRPSPAHGIGRIVNDGNYEPSNCRWTTIEVQAYNKRNTLRFSDDTPIGLFAKNNNLNYDVVRYNYYKDIQK